MNLLKRFLVVLVVFLVLVVLISMFLPSSLRLERSIEVDADREQVFKQVNNLKNWKNWSPWAAKDSLIYLDDSNFSTPSSGVNATFSWDSEHDEVGSGTMEIVASEVNQKVDYELNLGMGEMLSSIRIEKVGDKVEVFWSVEIDFGFNSIAKFFGLFIEDAIVEDYENGLQRLKRFSENLPKINTVNVTEKRVAKSWFLSIRDSIDPKEMNNVHGKMYATINAYLDENSIEINGSPIVIYHFWSDTLVDIEAGLPVKDSMEVNHESIQLNSIQSGKVVTATHYGAYERLPETYFGINEWMRKNKVVVTGPPWEEYLTDPATESNPDKWKTAIYFPIE